MFCEGCQKIKTIPLCSADVTIGTIALNNTAVLVIIADEQTGREWYKQVTSGAAGEVVVDFSDFDFLSDNFRYSVKVIEGTTLANYNDPLPITVDALPYDCLYMDFSAIMNNADGLFTGAAAITLEADV